MIVPQILIGHPNGSKKLLIIRCISIAFQNSRISRILCFLNHAIRTIAVQAFVGNHCCIRILLDRLLAMKHPGMNPWNQSRIFFFLFQNRNRISLLIHPANFSCFIPIKAFQIGFQIDFEAESRQFSFSRSLVSILFCIFPVLNRLHDLNLLLDDPLLQINRIFSGIFLTSRTPFSVLPWAVLSRITKLLEFHIASCLFCSSFCLPVRLYISTPEIPVIGAAPDDISCLPAAILPDKICRRQCDQSLWNHQTQFLFQWFFLICKPVSKLICVSTCHMNELFSTNTPHRKLSPYLLFPCHGHSFGVLAPLGFGNSLSTNIQWHLSHLIKTGLPDHVGNDLPTSISLTVWNKERRIITDS